MPLPPSLTPAFAGGPLSAQLNLGVDLMAGRITVAGELNRENAHHLLDATRTLSATPHESWVVNVDGMHCCDPTGLRAIGACYRRAFRRGCRMTVVGANPGLRAALGALRVDDQGVAVDGNSRSRDADRADPLATVPA